MVRALKAEKRPIDLVNIEKAQQAPKDQERVGKTLKRLIDMLSVEKAQIYPVRVKLVLKNKEI